MDRMPRPTTLPCPRQTIKSHVHVQVYINGEFVGGADILEEMSGKGELRL